MRNLCTQKWGGGGVKTCDTAPAHYFFSFLVAHVKIVTNFVDNIDIFQQSFGRKHLEKESKLKFVSSTLLVFV